MTDGSTRRTWQKRRPELALLIGIVLALLVSGGMLLGLIPAPF